ncbi:unnamed protein product [Calicophoron daubneyi]|uniref:Uncharacterized protein n=1 Tax=Calicophoron daubneyi TaxID=300641 RepID=A0AAV2TLD1_CALDB
MTTTNCVTLIFLLALLDYLDYLPTSTAVDITPCPSSCKCSPIDESNGSHTRTPKRREQTEPIMATCWIPSNLNSLPCSLDWSILHLQVLNGQSKEAIGKVVKKDETDSVDIDLSSTTSSSDSATGKVAEAQSDVSVSSDLFETCTSLTRLAIWERSQFTSLPKFILRPLVNLTRLVIQVPTLQRLPEHFLAFLPKLNFVMISKCRQLIHIDREVFEPCPASLRTLWLNGNGLKGKLQPGLFRQCNLRTLWLNNNQLDRLDWGSLKGLSQLTALRLDQNHFNGSLENCLSYREDVKSTALGATPRLKILDLSSNNLTTIEGSGWSGVCKTDPKQPSGLCYLEELKLSDNHLSWLGPDALAELPSLQILRLDGNQQLYAADSASSLSLVLFAISVYSKHLNSLWLTIPITDITSRKKLQTRQLDKLDACKPDPILLSYFPRTLISVIQHLNKTSCNRFAAVEPEAVVANVTQTRATMPDSQSDQVTEVIRGTNGNSSSIHEGPIMAFIRQADRVSLLLLSFGLLFLGVLLGLLPFIYIVCMLKHKQKIQKKQAKRYAPFLVHPAQETGYILPQRPSDGVLLSPLPVRSKQRSTLPSPPHSITSVSSHYRLSRADYPFDPAHFQPSLFPTKEQPGRRVCSMGDVYHRSRMNGYPRSPPRPLPQHLITNGHISPQQHSQSIMLSDMRPLLASNSVKNDSVYNPTVETNIGGSTYSLATIASFNPHANGEATGLVPTGKQVLV